MSSIWTTLAVLLAGAASTAIAFFAGRSGGKSEGKLVERTRVVEKVIETVEQAAAARAASAADTAVPDRLRAHDTFERR